MTTTLDKSSTSVNNKTIFSSKSTNNNNNNNNNNSSSNDSKFVKQKQDTTFDNNTESSLLISEIFDYNKSRIQVRVDFYNTHLDFTELTGKNGQKLDEKSIRSPKKLSIKDIAGSSIAKSNNLNSHDCNVCLTLHAYPRIQNLNHNKRKRVQVDLCLNKFTSYEENLEVANNFHKKLNFLIKNIDLDSLERSFSSSNDANNKPFLVFINPHSGAGKAQRVFFENALPVWSQANIPYTIILTKYANYASEYMQTVKVEDYRGIIVVSGDGLIYEVINGIMNRSDWPTAIKIPIGQIPGGSANALACCTAYLSGEAFKNMALRSFAESMAFHYTKSKSTPMDLVTVQLHNKKIIHSFLNIEWAIVADVDLESEKYRFLGNTRFLVGALKRILNLRIYRGRISFLPADEMKDYKPKDPNIIVKYNSIESSERKLSDNPTEYSMFNIAGAASMLGTSISSMSGQNIDFKYLTPIDKPVPSDWTIIEDNFVFFLISHLPLISPDFLSAPEAQFSNGNMYLTFIRQGITKLQLLKLFKDMETGDYLESPYVEYVKIKAFRLEPLERKYGRKRTVATTKQQNEDINNNSATSENATDPGNKGIMMVDGEQVPYGIIQGEIKPALANVLICQ